MTQLQAESSGPDKKTVVLAGGCFWCMEPPFDELKDNGILKTTVGYAGGESKDPSYDQVASGKTQHLEAIELTYDPKQISLDKIYAIFWKNIDPFDEGGQFCDRGRHYRAAVFFQDEKQKKSYQTSRKKIREQLGQTKKLAVLEISSAKFYSAEKYHQDYYLKNPIRYKFYRYSCGRDDRLEEVWGD